MFKDESSNQSMLRAFLAIITTGSVCATVEPRSWMSDMTRADSRFGKLSIEDLVLPGSHDTLSYELSDELTELPVTPPAVGSLVRSFAVTQTINITQQLDAGIRFVDLRVMKVPDGEWYGTHTVRTKKAAGEFSPAALLSSIPTTGASALRHSGSDGRDRCKRPAESDRCE